MFRPNKTTNHSGIVLAVAVLASPAWGEARAVRAQTPQSDGGSSVAAAEQECQAAPQGMVCIPGGVAVIGADDHPMESPRHEVEVSTFYMDKYEVTNGDYQKCEWARACPKRKRPSYYRAFQQKERPVVPTTWEMAHQYCVWAGKRLPTEAEWEKVARHGAEGRTYPWGDEPPTCDKAHFKKCKAKDKLTKKVGSFPAGAYGVFDMAGNGYEWVKDWATDCYGGCKKACGADCQGKDPRGPCDGADRCKGHRERVLKGGSWYWPEEMLRGSWRRAQRPNSGLHRLSFRCASSRADLYGPKPLYITDPLPDPPPLSAPTAEQLRMFNDVVEDTDIFQIPTCKAKGTARVDCRDPLSYITSNEAYQYLFRKPVKNLGGGYVGVASDQNYSFMAAARSEWAWLFDYDPAVVRVHYIAQAILRQVKDRRGFVAAYTKKHSPETIRWIEQDLAHLPPDEVKATVRTYQTARMRLWSHYARQLKQGKVKGGFGWLRYDDNFAHIKAMADQGRTRVLKGNMLTDKAMPSIAKAAREMGVTIRVYYPSNAEEQWKNLPQQYRDNVIALPFDERSVILRTIFNKRYHQAESKWHYIVHGGLHAQEHIALPGYKNVWRFMEDRQRVGQFLPEGQSLADADPPVRDYFSLIGMIRRTEHDG